MSIASPLGDIWSSDVAQLSVHLPHRLVFVSAAAGTAALYRRDASSLRGTSFLDLIPPAIRSAAAAHRPGSTLRTHAWRGDGTLALVDVDFCPSADGRLLYASHREVESPPATFHENPPMPTTPPGPTPAWLFAYDDDGRILSVAGHSLYRPTDQLDYLLGEDFFDRFPFVAPVFRQGITEHRDVAFDTAIGERVVRGYQLFPSHATGINGGDAVCVALDVTDEHTRASEYNRLRRCFHHLLQGAPVFIWTVTADGVIHHAAGAALARLGVTDDAINGQIIWQTPMLSKEHLRLIARALGGQEVHGRLRSRRGRFEIAIHPQRDERGAVEAVIEVGVDISDRTKILRELNRRESEIQELLKQVVNAQEDERRRLAWDIHDDVIQGLIALRMSLETAASAISDKAATGLIGVALNRSDELVRRLRNLLDQIDSGPTDGESLEHSIAGLLSLLFPPASPVRALVNVGLLKDPDRPQKVVLYRIAQEALTNVLKHAQASRVTVIVKEERNGVRLRVRDNGIGLKATPAPRGEAHVGITSMRERARMAGGRAVVRFSTTSGTMVSAWIPNASQP